MGALAGCARRNRQAGKKDVVVRTSEADGNASTGRPSPSVGGRGHHQRVAGAARNKTAVLPDRVNRAGSIDSRTGQHEIAQAAVSMMKRDVGNMHVRRESGAAIVRSYGDDIGIEGVGADGNDFAAWLRERLHSEIRGATCGLHRIGEGESAVGGDGEIENVARAVVVPLRVAVTVVGAASVIVATHPRLVGLGVSGAEADGIVPGETAIGGAAD